MDENFLLPVYFVVLWAGYLLPIASIILAWREWTETKKVPPARAWRRTISQVGLLLFTAGLAFGVSVAVAELRLGQQSYYDSWAMYVGEFGSIATIGVSVFAEKKLRRYLLLGAIGLLCLFCVGLVEAI
jgi:hypothetical protein